MAGALGRVYRAPRRADRFQEQSAAGPPSSPSSPGTGSRGIFVTVSTKKLAHATDDSRFSEQKTAYEMAVSGAPLDQVLTHIVRAAQELTGEGARAALFVVDTDGTRLR